MASTLPSWPFRPCSVTMSECHLLNKLLMESKNTDGEDSRKHLSHYLHWELRKCRDELIPSEFPGSCSDVVGASSFLWFLAQALSFRLFLLPTSLADMWWGSNLMQYCIALMFLKCAFRIQSPRVRKKKHTNQQTKLIKHPRKKARKILMQWTGELSASSVVYQY